MSTEFLGQDALTDCPSAELDSAKESVKARQFERAMLILKRLTRGQIREMDLRNRCEFLFLCSICYRETGELNNSLRYIRAGLRLSRPSSEHELYARGKQIHATVLSRLGRTGEAIESYLECFASFKRSGNCTRLFGPLTNIGLIYFGRGELRIAMDRLEDALGYASRYNTSEEVSLCIRNLSRVLILSGEFESAKMRLVKEGCEFEHTALSALNETLISQIEAFKLEYSNCNRNLHRCLRQFQKTDARRDVAVCLEYLGLNEYFSGNYEKAREYYNQVLAMPEPTASAAAQTLRMLTDVEVAEGNWPKAEETAAKAEAAILKISEKIELGALWRAYGEIYTHKQDSAKAREFFEKSIDLLKALGARYELALSHLVAGQSASFTQEQRVDQLQAAKALFIDMEVPKRIEQVDRLLKKLDHDNPVEPRESKRNLTLKSKSCRTPRIIAVSESMKRLVDYADRVKNSNITVLITGETGTGKDLLAEYIHYTSNRSGKPFVPINCAAIPESMAESELFGFKKGSYTGANYDNAGLIDSARGGTFCLDEIGEMPMPMQAKLLRVIDTKVVRRLGTSADIPVDVRFIALTNRNLQDLVAKNQFRLDLLHRLSKMTLDVRPLRERREDIMPLAQYMFEQLGIDLLQSSNGDLDELRTHLEKHVWPGNVRELVSLVERVQVLRGAGSTEEIVPLILRELGVETSESVLRKRVSEAFNRNKGNLSQAAKDLNMPRSTYIYHLKRFALDG